MLLAVSKLMTIKRTIHSMTPLSGRLTWNVFFCKRDIISTLINVYYFIFYLLFYFLFYFYYQSQKWNKDEQEMVKIVSAVSQVSIKNSWYPPTFYIFLFFFLVPFFPFPSFFFFFFFSFPSLSPFPFFSFRSFDHHSLSTHLKSFLLYTEIVHKLIQTTQLAPSYIAHFFFLLLQPISEQDFSKTLARLLT